VEDLWPNGIHAKFTEPMTIAKNEITGYITMELNNMYLATCAPMCNRRISDVD
jgi:hypothetical protein